MSFCDFSANMNFIPSTVTYESVAQDYDDFPFTQEPVCILGQAYSAIHDRDELKDDIRSRIWITYRKGFSKIGGTGPDYDNGWGCMLRCGQMMLAQALVLRHLGRGWRWKAGSDDPDYWKLLRMFEDKKGATYSIHQIALMGESEGKAVGQWFGPNTIAQVLKKTAAYDSWSQLAIHISLDNVVIREDIRNLCSNLLPEGEQFSSFVNGADASATTQGQSSSEVKVKSSWKPLLLIIPLRLGLTEINPIYFDALKKCLALHQSVGIIGGKPNHAHWFIGCVGQELIYLDPHTTQPAVNLSQDITGDHSYHCPTPASRMSFNKLDPSIALGFYCKDEEDFENLCKSFDSVNAKSMFEVRETAPEMIPYLENTTPSSHPGKRKKASLSDFNITPDTSSLDDEEDFEIVGI